MLVVVLNGANLNLLGTREPELYGTATLADIERDVRSEAARLELDLEWFQTNHEGELIEAVHHLRGRAAGALLNPGAWTHTSLALRDAWLAVRVPFVEVHLSNIFARETERRQSLLADLALGVVTGFGPLSYRLGLQGLAARLR